MKITNVNLFKCIIIKSLSINLFITVEQFITANYGYTHLTITPPDTGSGTSPGAHIQFAVRASSDALVLLSRHPYPAPNEPVYELVIGGTNSGTTTMHTAIRRLQRGPELGATATPDIINSRTFVCFWLDVTATGLISLGRAGNPAPIFQYQDINPPVYPAYYSFSSDYIFQADWHEPCGCSECKYLSFFIHDNLEPSNFIVKIRTYNETKLYPICTAR